MFRTKPPVARALFIFVLGLLACAAAVPAQAMTFRLGASGTCGSPCPTVIVAEGEITNGTPNDFLDFVRGNLGSNSHAIVFLNSPGGKVVAAIELGKIFRRRGIAAAVAQADSTFENGRIRFTGAKCYSACVYALMGAKQRIVPRQSTVGLHRMFASEPGSNAPELNGDSRLRVDDGKMAAVLQRYSGRMGVNPELVRVAEHGSPDSLRVLTRTEIAKWHLASP